MAQQRKRKFDIDADTPARMIATLDIIDDYPLLSKQLQAGCAMRNLDLKPHVMRAISMRTTSSHDNIFILLTNIIKESIARYFNGELELYVIERENGILYNINDPGCNDYIEWSEKKKKQPFDIKRNESYRNPYHYFSPEEIQKFIDAGKVIPSNGFGESQVFYNEENTWLLENPMPESLETENSFKLDIYTNELDKFLQRYKNILNNYGIEFFFESDRGEYDGISVFVSKTEFLTNKQLHLMREAEKNQPFDLEKAIAEAPVASKDDYGENLFKFQAGPTFDGNQHIMYNQLYTFPPGSNTQTTNPFSVPVGTVVSPSFLNPPQPQIPNLPTMVDGYVSYFHIPQKIDGTEFSIPAYSSPEKIRTILNNVLRNNIEMSNN